MIETTLRRIEVAVLLLAATLAVVAIAFYWTRYWIHFTRSAIPWLFYPLIPYLALGGIGYLLNRKKKLMRREVTTLIGALLLLGLTVSLYLPFFDGSLVFYLRMSLGMSLPWLGTVTAVTLLLSWVIGLGANASSDPPLNRTRADDVRAD